jgi:hypothetical protein
LTKLLILLGIVFLFGLLRDVLSPQISSALPLAKMNQLIASCPLRESSSSYDAPEEKEKAKALDAIELSLTDVVENRGFVARIKERIGRQMKGWGETSWGLTLQARQQIDLIRNEALRD